MDHGRPVGSFRAEPWTTRRIVLRHRRLDRFELRVTAVRIGSSRWTNSPKGAAPATPAARTTDRAALVDRPTMSHGDDDDDDEFFSPGALGAADDSSPSSSNREYSSRPPPRAARRATRYRNDMYQTETPGRSEPGGARGSGTGGDAVKEHTSVLHAMSGVMAKEFTVALQREIQARAAVESEVTDLHRASGELREWALKELDRLRTYAQTQVNELVAECAKRRDEANAYKSRMEEHAESSKTLDRALTRAFARRRKRSLQTRGFDALKTHAAQLARRRRLFTRVGSRMAKRAMARAFDAWSAKTAEAAALRARMTQFATRWRNASAAAAFRTWRIAWRKSAMRRAAAREMASKARLRCVGPALRRWAAATRRNRAMTRNFRRFIEGKARRDVAAVVREWFDASQDARLRRRQSAAKTARLVAKRERDLRVGVFTEWFDYAGNARRVRRLVSRSAARVGRKIFAASFVRWRSNAKETRARRRLVARMFAGARLKFPRWRLWRGGRSPGLGPTRERWP